MALRQSSRLWIKGNLEEKQWLLMPEGLGFIFLLCFRPAVPSQANPSEQDGI